jgi:hypothetical protein
MVQVFDMKTDVSITATCVVEQCLQNYRSHWTHVVTYIEVFLKLLHLDHFVMRAVFKVL